MNVQHEFSSFKHLLKQVYSAHSTKVKGLENEIKILKEKLTESERKANVSVSDCKRCIELEEAFKSCKKALSEQSKWFENFGEKFSIFNSSHLENQEFKDGTKSYSDAQAAANVPRNSSKDTTFCDKNVQEKDVDFENYEKCEKKLSTVSGNQNLLSKVMLDGESFDVYTVTFNKSLKHDNMNSKSDSLILAPDTLNTALDIPKQRETGLKEGHIKKAEKSEKLLESVEQKVSKSNDKNLQETKVARKRLSSETLNEDRVKRCNKGNLSESSSETMIKSKEINSGITVPKTSAAWEITQISKSLESKTKDTTDLNSKNDERVCKKKSTVTITETSKDSKNEASKSSTLVNNSVTDLKNKNLLNQTSPSLIPTHINAPQKIIDLESIPNDDDFQELVPNSKPLCSEDSWDTCDRKKSLRKNKNTKHVKSTSKYKMTLDAPPLNYKKPTYKQTKLSKSIFQSKASGSNKKSPQGPTVLKNNLFSESGEDDFPSAAPVGDLQLFIPDDTIKSPTVVDIDATFIPENFKLESPQYNTTNVKKNTVEKSHLKNGNLFCNISFPDELKSSVKNARTSFVNEDEIKDYSCLGEVDLKENMNSFDRLPLPEEPNYKYKNDVVRKKAERRQLNGFGCKECEKYYSELGLTEKEKKERMKKCSRHRGKFSPPATPDHFWELDFPDTEECKARGYLNATQKVKLNNICDI